MPSFKNHEPSPARSALAISSPPTRNTTRSQTFPAHMPTVGKGSLVISESMISTVF